MIEQLMAERNLIYKIRTGSYMYGTNTENSDEDFSGIFIPDEDYVLGIKKCEQVILNQKFSKGKLNQKGDVDYTLYSIIKFIHLAIENNPNIIEFFYAPTNCILYQSKLGKLLIENRHLFLSKKAYHTFKGYAYAQRHKLEIKKENMTGRIELVAKYFYDTKFASHLIRLLLQALQIFIEKTLKFPLPENNLVRDIKLGKYSLEWVLKKAEDLEKLVDIAYVNSDLQVSADLERINKLQIKILQSFWSRNE